MKFTIRDYVWLSIVLTLLLCWTLDVIDISTDSREGRRVSNSPQTIISWAVGLFR